MHANIKELVTKLQKAPVTEYPNTVFAARTLSVIVQTYQHAPYIRQCIESIISQQTTFSIEILIGEDDSNDGTRSICVEYAEKYPDLIRLFLHNRKNNIYISGNPSGRFNLIYNLSKASGKYIAICEGDDYWTDPCKLQKQVDYLKDHSECSICFHNAHNLFPDGSLNDYLRDGFKINPKPIFKRSDILFHNFLPTCSVVFRNEMLNNIPEILLKFPVGDWILHILNASYGDIGYIDKFWSVRRKHDQGYISSKSRKEILEINVNSIKMISEFLKINYTMNADAANKLKRYSAELIKLYEKEENNDNVKKYKALQKKLKEDSQINVDSFLSPQCSVSNMDLYVVRSCILNALKQTIPKFHGILLDVGCGKMPYKKLLTSLPSKIKKYIGLDIKNDAYQNGAKPDLFWDGNIIPVGDNTVDCVIATEVFEHTPDPEVVMQQICRVLKPDGILFFTIPFLWPLHDMPYDEYRYTPISIKRHLKNSGFSKTELKPLGGWNAALAQMIGLWARRKPMENEKRETLSQQLFPFYKELIQNDFYSEDFNHQKMFTGIWGTTVKPEFQLKEYAKDNKSESENEELISKFKIVDYRKINEKMKNTHAVIIQSGFPAISATFILDQLTGLINRGIDIENWATYNPNEKLIHPDIAKFKLMEITKYINFPPERMKNDLRNWINLFLIQNQINNIDKVDIFHVHYGSNFNLIEPLFRYFQKKFVIVSFHGHDASRYFKQNGNNCYEYLFERSNMITTPSFVMKDELVKRGCLPEKVRVHRYGIDLTKFYCRFKKDRDSCINLLTVARLVEKKGIEYSLKAVASLPNSNQIIYRIIGDGPLRDYLQTFAKNLGIENQIKFLGAQTKNEVIKEMSNADIFLLNSITAQDGDMEGVPVSLIEAHAMGLPVVSTYHAGIPELVIDGKTGFLTQEKNVSQIAECLNKLISSSELRKNFSESAKKRIKTEFDIENLNDRLKGYYEQSFNKIGNESKRLINKRFENRNGTQSNNMKSNSENKEFNQQDRNYRIMSDNYEKLDALNEVRIRFEKLNWEQRLCAYEKYFEFAEIINRKESSDISIIIVCEKYSNDLIKNLEILNRQRDHNFSLILVNNGSKDSSYEKLKQYLDVYIELNKNTGAYFSRNVGAIFANAPILLFLDDDGIPENNLIDSHLNSHRKYDVIAVRGVCLPKTENPLNDVAKHYYLGSKPFAIYADIEGNTSYLAYAFFKAGGWDDEIKFGGGGVDLSRRLLDIEPDHRKQIYSPDPIIYHDYASSPDHLEDKRKRQKQSWERIKAKYPDYDSFLASWSPYRGRDDLLIEKSHFEESTFEPFKELISILIPSYNREQYITLAMESALSQRYKNIEILVIDDGSTDNTNSMVNQFGSEFVRYIRKDHTGAPDTRNRGIKEARGKYILWLDSDDILLPDVIDHYVSAISKYPDVDVFYGDLSIIDESGNFKQELKYPDYYEQNDALLSRLLICNSIPNPGTLVKKSVYQKYGDYSLNFKRAHDYEFWARVVNKIKFKHVGAFVCKWRWHDTNMSSGSVQFDTSFDIEIKKSLLKTHSLQKFFPQLNWNDEKKSLETAYFVIGNSFNQLKGYQEAIEYYERCLEINKSDNCYCALGATYFQAGDLKKSIWAFREALKMNPQNEKAKEILENLNKIISAKNQQHPNNEVTSDFYNVGECQHAEEIGPKISIIVPTYNRPQMLKESVKSILSQIYQNFEIIVVNDGGLDVSRRVDNFKDPRIKYISHTKNKGLAAARNTGIRNASGQYIALLDDDDIFYPEHLQTAVDMLSKEIPVIYTDAVRATYERCGDNYRLIKKNVPYSIDFDRNKLLVSNLSPVNCFVFEKSLALKAGLFDETLSTLEDWEFWIRLSSFTCFKHIPKPTVQVNWRSDGTTMTSMLGAEFKKNRQRIYDKYQDEINRIPNVKEILNEFQKIWAQDWQAESSLTSIIILTCNQLRYTKACIESIFQNTKKPYELIIVDNGSTDGTVEYLESEVLRKHTDVRIKIIKNNENKGFAGGNNQGIAAASGDYILLLNNDVVVTPGWLKRMLSCAEKRPEIGIVGPRSNYVSGHQLVKGIDYDTHTLKGLAEFSNKFADDHAGQAQQVLRVVGFCMLIKRGVIDKIGAMDDRYGLGNFEDDDFSLRAAIAGFQSWIARDCFIHHFGHRTFIGENVDLNKSLQDNWGVFKEKWGLPADKPYGSSYSLSEMKHTQFDPSIHYYPLGDERAAMDEYNNDFKTAETLYADILANLSTKPSKEVIEDLQRLVESYPEFALAYNDLGVLYYKSGKREKALKCYERAVQLDPVNSNFSKNLADFYFVEMGWVEEALQIYVKILERNPQDIETLLISGHICVSLRQFEDAKVFYRRVLELDPSNEAAQNNLNKLDTMNPAAPELKSPEEMYQEIQPLLNNGDPHQAIGSLEKLLQSYPIFALAHNDLGVLYYHTGDKEKARYHYERAVELMPDNINFQKNLADLYCIVLGRIEEALQIYVRILQADPKDVEALMATGLICKALEKTEDAKHFFERILVIEPDNLDARQQLSEMESQSSLVYLGSEPAEDAYRRVQEKLNTLTPSEAIVELERLVERYPDFAAGHNDLGVLYYQTGNKEKAWRHYQQATRLQPDNMTLQKNLADFLFVELGRMEEALQIYINVVTVNPNDVETLLIIGHICVALKKFDDAQEFYRRVLAIEPGNQDAIDKVQALNKYLTVNGSLPSESISPHSADAMAESNNSGPDRSVSEKKAETVSIIISIDGIQNRVKECLKSIQAHTPEPHELLLVDCGATRGMLKWVQQLINDNDHCHIIECARQAGRAESFNQAIQKSSGEIMVLMHNDVVVPEDWLKGFKMSINLEPNIGVVGPMSNRAAGIQQLAHSDESDRIEFESLAKAFSEQNQYRRVPTQKLSDFCLAFRRELPDTIGYFDEQFASEEMIVEDFCSRAAAGGYQNLIVADTYVFHYDRHKVKKNTSTDNSAGGEDRKKYKEKWNCTQNKKAKALQTVQYLSNANKLSQKGQIDQAVEVLLNAMRVQPEEKRLYLELAEILLAAKRFQDAKEALNEMPSPSENGDQEIKKVLLLGYAEEGMENYEAAWAYTEQVLALDPNHARALNLKGILAYRDNDRDSAEKYFKRAIASDRGYGEPHTNLAMLQLEAEQSEEALKFFEKGFILSPTDLDIATNYHAFIEGLGDFEKAEAVARQAAELYPSNQKIKYMLIDFIIRQGKYAMAMPEIEDAVIKFGIADGILSAALKVREKLGPMTINNSSKKAPVSLCMIIKDEEKYLARCLASVKPIVDEMIVVDTGSTDRSKDIAITFGAKVYDYEWRDDFAAARNYSISKASGEWILILDGDEVISRRDHAEFNKIVKKIPRAPIAYSVTTRNYSKVPNIVGWMPNDGQYPDEEATLGWLPSEKVRLFYGKDQIRFEGAVHEMVDPLLKRNAIEIKKCRIAVHHYGRLDQEKLGRKGETYFDIGQKKLSEKGEDVRALWELAIQATVLEKNQQALELWQRLLALNPNPKLAANAYVNMGNIYNRLGTFEDALIAGKKAVEYDPDLKEAQYNLALAELQCGNAPKTISILEDLLNRFPDYPPAQFILSAAYCCAGPKEKGLDGIRKLKNTPLGAHLEMPCLELAQSLLAAKKVEYALRVLGAAIECDIVNKEILDLFTECIKMNDTAQKLPEIPPTRLTDPTGLTGRQPVKFEDLPQ